MKVTDMRDDEIVQLYIALRDRRATRKAKYDADDADDKAKQEKLEGIMLHRMQESGSESIRTQFGTAFKSTRTSATVADRDMFLQFVRENEAWEMLESRVNKTAVEQYRAANDEIPPGVNVRTEVTVNFRRS